MAYKCGLKLWSINTDYYYDEAKRLYSKGVFDYIELYVVPGTLDTLPKWKELHNPLRHFVPLPPKGADNSLVVDSETLWHFVPLPPEGADQLKSDSSELRRCLPLPSEGADVLFSKRRKYAPYMKDFARKLRKNMTKQEVVFWQQIRKNRLGVRFRRQHSIDDQYIADFYCHEKRLIIEIDGGQHCNSFEDVQRTFYLESRGYRIIRFWNNEINENLSACIDFLYQEINSNLPPLGEVARSAEGGIPFIIHAPHFAHGFNLAKKDKEESNLAIYREVKQFADELDAPHIIFHGGIEGDIEETARQLANFNEPRALIENKPYRAPLGEKKLCRGYSIQEISKIINETGCGLCLDIGHAICSANSLNEEPYNYLKQFNDLAPIMYHISGNIIDSDVDKHLHLCEGNYDYKKIFDIINCDSYISIETNKDFKENLKDYEEDIFYMKGFVNE